MEYSLIASEIMRYPSLLQSHRTRRKIQIGISLFVVYSIVFQIFYNQMVYKTVYPYRDLYDLLMSTVTNVIPMAVILAINIYVVFKLTKIKNILFKTLTDFGISFVITIGVNHIYLLCTAGTRYNEVDWPGTLFNNLLVFIGISALYYADSFQRQQQETSRQRELALQYEYMSLRAQINPHFLFNSLNTLYSLVSIHQEKSKEFILRLSGIYRYVLQNSGRNLVALEEEIAFLREYASVISTRYYNQFELVVADSRGMNAGVSSNHDTMVVPFTMQLLLENVIKHNVISSRHNMTVVLSIDHDVAVMINPIRPRKNPNSTGFGLSYLQSLYANYGRNFYTVRQEEEFIAHIPLIHSRRP